MSGFVGGCHCGAIRYTCSADPYQARYCQCSDCRRLSGSGHASLLYIRDAGAVLRVTGAPRSYDTHADSGNVLTRHFCGTCGSPLYITNSGVPGMVIFHAGSLDDPSLFKPTHAIFTASAPAWDVLDPALERFPRRKPRPQ